MIVPVLLLPFLFLLLYQRHQRTFFCDYIVTQLYLVPFITTIVGLVVLEAHALCAGQQYNLSRSRIMQLSPTTHSRETLL